MAIATHSGVLSTEHRGFMRGGLRGSSLLLLLLLLPSLLQAGSSDDQSRRVERRPGDSLPIVFRDAADPRDPGLLYRGDGARGRVGFMRDGVRYAFTRDGREMVVGVGFEGSNGGGRVTAEEGIGAMPPIYMLDGTGTEATTIRQYSRILYHDLYDGIDIGYYSAAGSLKYDCIVKPGADPARIRMRYDGVERLAIGPEGDLVIVTEWGELRERHPYVYQIVDGVEKKISASFRLMGDRSFGFEIGHYDRTLPLVIDPMVLGWSTFVGGTGTGRTPGDGYVYDMAIDSAGDVYCTGWYNRTFPTTPGVYSTTYSGGIRDAYVFKLSSDGRQLLFSTYIGGPAEESGHAIALGSDGSIYIGGHADSLGFPHTAGAYSGGSQGNYDCFILKLSSDGKTLLYSTRFGASGNDSISRIHVDAAGAVTAVGITQGDTGAVQREGFPTTPGAYDRTFNANGTASDIFVVRLSPDGRSLVFSTLVGGSFGDFGADLAIDANGEIVVTGSTYSADFPTTEGAYDRSPNGVFRSDAFLLRLSPNAGTLVSSTLFGGTGDDGANALELGTGGRVVIAGYAASDDLPTTAGAFDRNHFTARDGFVAILENNGSRLVAASYVGSGGFDDEIQDLEIDTDGSIYIAGKTRSENAVTPRCPIGGASDGYDANTDIYVARMTADLRSMLFADFIGGRANDYGTQIAFHPDRCRRELAVSITVHSDDFPTTPGVFQPTKLNGDDDQPIVMKIRPTITPRFRSSVDCSVASFTDMTTGSCVWGDTAWRPTTWLWDFGDGTTSTERNPTHRYLTAGNYRVTLRVGCPRDSFSSTVVVLDEGEPMQAHIGREHVATPGDTIGIPMILDAVGDAAPIRSLRITLRYDTLSMRLVNITPNAIDSLFHESILADWRMTVDTLRNGTFSALLVAPPGSAGLTAGGRLLYLRFMTYIRPNATPSSPWSDTTRIPFEIIATGALCGIGATDPGLLRLELCGLAYRLIEMGAEKYALTLGPPNPFSGPVSVNFTLGLDGPTTVTVFDAMGTRVATLLDRHLAGGGYTLTWEARDLPSGLYYVRIISGDWTATGSMIKAE